MYYIANWININVLTPTAAVLQATVLRKSVAALRKIFEPNPESHNLML